MTIFRDYIFPGYTRLSRTSRIASRRNTDRGRLVQTAAVLAAAVGIDTNLTMAYQLFALLFCLILFSRFSVRFTQPELRLTRRLPRYATAGEPFTYTVRVTNCGNRAEHDLQLVDNPRTRPPSFEQYSAVKEPFEETRNWWDRFVGFHRFIWLQRLNTGITTDNAPIPDLDPQSTVSVTVKATPLRRGVVTLETMTVLAPDPFSLNYATQHHPAAEQLMILPRRYPLAIRDAWSGGRHHQPGGARPAWSVGESDEFVALRDYRAGDSQRKIHWSSTARRGKPVVKEFQDEYLVRHTLVLDTDTPDLLLFEEAVSIAASILAAGERSDTLTDLMFVGEEVVLETAGDPFASSTHQLETLATVQPVTGSAGRLVEQLRRHQRRMSDCIAILCGWDQARETLVEQLRVAGVPLRILLVAHEQPTDLPGDIAHIDPDDVIPGLAAL